MNKFLGITIAVLGIALAAVPFVTDCQAHGKLMANGMPMACSDARVPDAALGGSLVVAGAVMATPLSRKKGVFFGIAGLAVVLGAAGALVPHTLTHTCANPAMFCNTEMVPALWVVGGFTVVGGVTGLIVGLRKKL